MSTTTTTNSSNQSYASSYRIKFKRDEYIELLSIAKPKLLYQVNNFIYFCFDGFVMYCNKLLQEDLLSYHVIKGIEFSNVPWTKR